MSGIDPTVTLYLATGLLVLGIFIAVFSLARAPVKEPPKLGLRGLKRHQARERLGFAAIDPLVRLVAAWVAHVPVTDLRRQSDRDLVFAGDYLGLTADEHLALSFLCGVTGAAAAFSLSLGPAVVILAFLLGLWFPRSRVRHIARERRRRINRELPAAIEVAALSMSAGLDLPAALRQLVATSTDGDPLREELELILRLLQLGHTRRQTMQNFAARVPIQSVNDMVAAVMQSEERGNPLAEALRIQASVSRTRRSILAEEAAAKASVKLIVPLTLMLAATLTIVAGPLVIQTMDAMKAM
jgi:tight adherence protein C